MIRRPLVLVVDDNPVTLRLVRATLQGEGWEVRTAVDAATAEAAFDRERPDAVLVDLSLPDVDGFTLAKRLHGRGRGVPLVAYSALLDALGTRSPEADLFVELLPKPIEPADLIGALRRHVPHEEPAERPGADRRVLVVDDDAQNRRMLAAHFGALGFRVDVAEDAIQALSSLHMHPADVVVSDVLMPTVDGYELCMAIRRWPERADIPVVLVTSNYDEEADVQMARKAGATTFLVRGASLDALTDSVLACLSSQRVAPPVSADAERERWNRARRQLERQAERSAALTRENELLSARLASLCALAEAGGRAGDDGPVGEMLQNFCAAAGLAGGALWLSQRDGDLKLVCSHALDLDQVPVGAVAAAWGEGRATPGCPAVVSVECRGDRIGVLALRGEDDLTEGEELARAVATQLGHSIGLTRAFERVARAEVRWAALMEHANDAIAILDDRGRYVEVNRRWEDLTGVARGDSVGRHMVDFFPHEIREERRAYVQTVLAAGGVTRQGDTWYRADGTPTTVDFTVSVVDIGDERFAITIARDVTDRARLESELRQAHKMEAIGRLAAGVAHDFNSLLTVILTDAHLLAEAVKDPSAREMIGEIRDAAERGGALTRHLLAFGRKATGLTRTRDLNALVHGCAPVLRRLVGPGVEVRVTPSDTPAMVRAEETELEQVLLNLVANARDAMSGEGTLSLSVELDGDRVVLRVSDTGGGMDEATQARIFEPFFTTKEPDRGTGLGLATVQAVVQRLGGDVRVDSAVGVGSTFHVRLPRARTQPVTRRTVLVVSEQAGVREALARSLVDDGYEVLQASDPTAELALAADGELLAAVVADVALADVSGLELVRQLRVSRPSLPAVFVSTAAVVPNGTGDAVLRVPVTGRLLRATLAEAIDHAAA